jgi:lipooligosaccharide transport system permease protein
MTTESVPDATRWHGARHVIERNVLTQRRCWLAFVSGFFEPFFYLISLSVGVSRLVGDLPGPGGHPLSYQAFVAPAMVASAAMNGAVFDASYNLHHKLRTARVFEAIRATPVSARDIAIGEVASSAFRGGVYGIVFIAVMAPMGLLRSWWAALAVPVVVLVALVFAAVGAAATTFVRHWGDLEWVSVILLPLFLFSATFFPLSQYPPHVRPLVELSPLYHGVVVLRALTTGAVGPWLWWHVIVLVVLAWVGLAVASRRLERILAD